MKQLLLATLGLASCMAVPMVSANTLGLNATELTAGRNLRNAATQFCEVTVSSGNVTEATAIIKLPRGARLLDTWVKRPSSTRGLCRKSQLLGSANAVQCNLKRLMPNQTITLITRYHQVNATGGSCTGFIRAGSRR